MVLIMARPGTVFLIRDVNSTEKRRLGEENFVQNIYVLYRLFVYFLAAVFIKVSIDIKFAKYIQFWVVYLLAKIR
mgnify:CR=1 FL=1